MNNNQAQSNYNASKQYPSNIPCYPILSQRERSLIELKNLLAIAGDNWKGLPANSLLRLQIEDTLKYTKLTLRLAAYHEVFEEGAKVQWENFA
jgi:hypothetical protein